MKGLKDSRRNAGTALRALIAACASLPLAACSGASSSKATARAPNDRYASPGNGASAPKVPAKANAIGCGLDWLRDFIVTA